MNIDSIILEESRIHFPIRTCDLVHHVVERTGRGERTVYRRLEKLKNEGTIRVLDSNTLNATFQYACHDEKACYVVVYEMVGIFTHFDEILHDIAHKDDEEILTVLDEVLLYKNSYLLNPVQLDEIVNVLKRDTQIDYIALYILYEHLINHDILPRNSTALVKNLREMIRDGPEGARYGPIRRWSVHMLGYFNDLSVLDSLEYDSSFFERHKELHTIYTARYTANVISCNPSILFRMIARFRESGEDTRAEYIENIRRIALEHSDLKSGYQHRADSSPLSLHTPGSPPLKDRKQEPSHTGWWYK